MRSAATSVRIASLRTGSSSLGVDRRDGRDDFLRRGQKEARQCRAKGRLLNSARDRAAVARDYRGRVLRGKELSPVFVGQTGDGAEHDDRGCSGRQQRGGTREVFAEHGDLLSSVV